jgi:flagellar assembly protein FliH
LSDRSQPSQRSQLPRVLPAGTATPRTLEDLDAEFPSRELFESVRTAVASGGEAPPLAEIPQPRRLGSVDRILLEAHEIHRQACERAKQAQELEERAVVRVSEIEREAYEKGYQQGETAGLEMGRAKMEPALADLNALIEEIGKAHSEVVKANQDGLLGLAKAIATRILHRELSMTPDQIMTTLQEVLALVGSEQRVRLRVSQGDFQFLVEHQSELPALGQLGDLVTFEVDPDMVRGGCLVRTATGLIDATMETMHREMCEALTNPSDEAPSAPPESEDGAPDAAED